jgi:hypothetical protein
MAGMNIKDTVVLSREQVHYGIMHASKCAW